MPVKPVTKIDIKNLETLIADNHDMLTQSQKSRAKKAIQTLEKGAPSYQKHELPSIFQKNAKSTYEYGHLVTDTIVHWLKSGYVCGPFEEPPCEKFRVNSLMAVPQDSKVRIILNVSLPENNSFNSNIIPNSLEKVNMSSARNFGYTLKKCGAGAIMSKFDICDAYKQIPASPKDYRLQGFFWLGKFFIETTQIFGAASSVCNFDIQGNTNSTLAIVISGIDPILVHRHLDDSPVASPSNSNSCNAFSEAYMAVSKKLNVKLAEPCAKNEKAFMNQTNGKVLGIWFNTLTMKWHLPEEKAEETIRLIYSAVCDEFVSTLNAQKLLGHLNNVCLMSPFLQGFKYCIIEDLAVSLRNNYELVKYSKQAKEDLMVWYNFLVDKSPKPIPGEPHALVLGHLEFTSDAAGWPDNCSGHHRPAVATVGLNECGEIIVVGRMFWNTNMIRNVVDKAEIRYGNKTTFLEFVGILLPILSKPCIFKDKHVSFKTDNMGCAQAWSNRRSKEDADLSIVIRILHIACYILNTVIVISHVPRNSSWDSCLVDRLSRDTTTTSNDNKLLVKCSMPPVVDCFTRWLKNPGSDWSICDNVRCILEKYM